MNAITLTFDFPSGTVAHAFVTEVHATVHVPCLRDRRRVWVVLLPEQLDDVVAVVRTHEGGPAGSFDY